MPTYHFAHAVDDHLMRVNLVIRGEEWLPSVPMHLQLFEALGFEPPQYAHTSLLMKQIPGGKRKLSKRKDPEASVDFYTEAGYPAKAVLYYLRGLANGSLAEMPLDAALEAPIRLSRTGRRRPADRPGEARGHQRRLHRDAEHGGDPGGHARLGLAVRRRARRACSRPSTNWLSRRWPSSAWESPNPRKDLRKWSDFRSAYGFFFAELFTPVRLGDERLGSLPDELVRAFAADFADGYQDLADRQEWFDAGQGPRREAWFRANGKLYKQAPQDYPGSIKEASRVIRVALTGSTTEPGPGERRPRPGQGRGTAASSFADPVNPSP